MAEFEVAHIREQGQDMIIVPLKSEFEYRSSAEQERFHAAIQACASDAGLAGFVVLVWDSGGRTKFRAPAPWHPFLRGLSMDHVAASINRKLTCG